MMVSGGRAIIQRVLIQHHPRRDHDDVCSEWEVAACREQLLSPHKGKNRLKSNTKTLRTSQFKSIAGNLTHQFRASFSTHSFGIRWLGIRMPVQIVTCDVFYANLEVGLITASRYKQCNRKTTQLLFNE